MKSSSIYVLLALLLVYSVLWADDIDLKISSDTSVNGVSIKNNSGTTQMRVQGNGNVGIGTDNPNPSAIVDISSSNKAFMPPRMTSVQKLAIVNPTPGMEIFQTDGVSGMYVYTQSGWQKLDMGSVASVTASAPITSSGGTNPNIAMPMATTTQSGYLSATDWNTFNNKASVSDYTFAEINYYHGNGAYTLHAGIWEYANQTTVNIGTTNTYINSLPCIGSTSNYYQYSNDGFAQVLTINGLPAIVKILPGGAGVYRITQYINVEASNNGCSTEFEIHVSSNGGTSYTNRENLSCVLAVGANTKYNCGSSSGLVYLNDNDQVILCNRRMEGNDTTMKVFTLTLNVERVK